MLKFTKDLANYIEQSSVEKNTGGFQWLNPTPKNLDQSSSQSLLSKLPQEIQQNLIDDSNLRRFFENDIRALQLYLEVLPHAQILSEETLDDHIVPEEFNQFFRENYITNQAYKLTDKQRQKYTEKISKNMKWQDYVLLERNQSPDLNKLQPNYSIQYFLTNLNPTSRLDYLRQINKEQDTTIENQELNFQTSDLPELQTLNSNTEFQSQSFPTEINQNFSPYQKKEQKVSFQNKELKYELERQSPKNVSFDVPKLQLSNSGLTIQKVENSKPIVSIKDKGISHFEQKLQSQVINQISSQNEVDENLFYPQNQSQLTPKGLPKVSSPVTRRKKLNYAKIVGYSSAAGFSLGASGLTLLNTLFGS